MDGVVLEMMTINQNHRILQTGFVDIDRKIGYLRRGCVSLLGAHPGMGETALAAQFCANIADNGGTVAWFSVYNSAFDAARNIINAKPTFHSSNNIFLEDKIADVRELRLAVEKMKRKPDLIVIDHLQGMYRISKKCRAVYDMPYICASLKDLAKRYDIAVLIISNLMRVPKRRGGHMPLITDVPKWDKIKNYIDTVGLLYRSGYYELDCPDVQSAELFFRPSADSCGYAGLLWDGVNRRFKSVPYVLSAQSPLS